MTAADEPRDEHDAALFAHVRPAGHRNPEPAPRYDLVVLGAGTAGLVAAAGAAGLGARVALVERDRLGGDCLSFGCVPSKALLRSARVAGALARAPALGWRGVAGEPDFASVIARVRAVRARLAANDSVERFRGLGVDVFLGEARFVAPDAAEVGGARLRFRRAVVATGARAAVPPVEGLEAAGFLTNETVFDLTERPAALAVVGGGPIGCELAQAFRRLGSEVFLLEAAPRLLGREDARAEAVVRGALARDGVRIVLGATLARVDPDGARKRLRFVAGGAEETAVADAILVAAGRAPNVEELGLDAAGIAWERGRGVVVDDRLRTTNPAVYAAGDVCLPTRFTHAADASARIAIENALFLGRKRWSRVVVPWCTYTDPEVAGVGLGEADAEAAGMAVDTYLRPLAEVDRAVTDGDAEGFVAVRVRKNGDRIVGATIVAPHAGETIGEVATAMAAGFGLGRLSAIVHPYPTEAEALRQLGDAYRRTRLTPFARRALRAWLAWRPW